ncbi:MULTISPECIES: hypothetical protein [Amycolatopsis]|uniref:hypothetical protein n=1 Tax=Amycolatopsis TaxID=1813 RepID=UPI0015A7297F|nr:MULTISPECIES: hypothetical protein [Amycolatopsis]
MSIFTRITQWARAACTVLNALRSLAAAMYRLIITVILLATAAATLWNEVMPPVA